jgi:hypothetical protein
MAILDEYPAPILQFVSDALRSGVSLDLTLEAHRKKLNTESDRGTSGHRAIRNSDGSSMTIAQIAAAANLTVAQVMTIAGRTTGQ